MNTIELPKKLYVKTRECGSRFVTKTGQVVDKNTCFWNCLFVFLTKTLGYREVNIIKLKNDTTVDLPFQMILNGNQDPSQKGSLADHRVIQKTVDIFKINICLLTSGTHIYNFKVDPSNNTMCLFLHKNHFTLVEDDLFIQRMLSTSLNPNLVLGFQPVGISKNRKKRGKKGEKDTFIKVLKNGNKESLFETNLKEVPGAKILFEKPKRKRGKRSKKGV